MADTTKQSLRILPITLLHAHPANSNSMRPAMLIKLTAHIRNTGQYPPVIVRTMASHAHERAYQILDGHHRVRALKSLDHQQVCCVVWDVDDEQALILLATLNRLQGGDDPRKRAALIADLSAKIDLPDLSRLLPERLEQLEAMRAIHQCSPTRNPILDPPPPGTLPEPVYFFFVPSQKQQLEQRLKEIGGTRESALLALVHGQAARP